MHSVKIVYIPAVSARGGGAQGLLSAAFLAVTLGKNLEKVEFKYPTDAHEKTRVKMVFLKNFVHIRAAAR